MRAFAYTALLLFAIASVARGDIVDQQQVIPDYINFRISFYEPIGQSFAPLIAQHTGVDLWLHEDPAKPPLPLTVLIHSGTLTGPVVASSTLSPPIGTVGWVHFPLSFTAIVGDTYVIEANDAATAFEGRWWWNGWNLSLVDNIYPRGMGFLQGLPQPGLDLAFRTWVVPEPSMGAMLAAAGLLLMKRRR